MRRSCIFHPLLAAGLILFLWSACATAAQLKDIRVGEYEGFTRIVFEFDATMAPPLIESKVPGQLSVSFDGGDADLIRKIPVERSRHIGKIQIWQRRDNISAVLSFNYPHIRFESFPLSSPPRIAVDVYPVTTPPDTEQPAALPPGVIEDKEITETAPEKVTAQADKKAEGNKDGGTKTSLQHTADNENDGSSTTAKKVVHPKLPKLRMPDSDVSKRAAPLQPGESHPSQLQFYLVVALVIITIIILLLLLLMLLARNRLAEDDPAISAKEYLKHQDEKIEALNTRIKAQFKRYEEV